MPRSILDQARIRPAIRDRIAGQLGRYLARLPKRWVSRFR